jgi:hypothetical protein
MHVKSWTHAECVGAVMHMTKFYLIASATRMYIKRKTKYQWYPWNHLNIIYFELLIYENKSDTYKSNWNQVHICFIYLFFINILEVLVNFRQIILSNRKLFLVSLQYILHSMYSLMTAFKEHSEDIQR